MTNYRELTAPCGLDCFNCFVFVDNITEKAVEKIAGLLHLDPADVPCWGCRAEKGCRLNFTGCATLECATDRGVWFCFECPDFPCSRLQPAADCAERYPHNLKLYNLCRIEKIGIEKWAQEEAAEIRTRYFKGKFVVGTGPVLD